MSEPPAARHGPAATRNKSPASRHELAATRNGLPASRHEEPGLSTGFLLWRATLHWQRQVRAALAPHDLTHVQFVLLASLWWLEEHQPGPPSQAAVAAHAGTDPMMTSQVIRKLAGRGLVARQADPADSRALQLAATPAGRDLLAGALADVEGADEEFFAVLGEARPSFTAALGRLTPGP